MIGIFVVALVGVLGFLPVGSEDPANITDLLSGIVGGIVGLWKQSQRKEAVTEPGGSITCRLLSGS